MHWPPTLFWPWQAQTLFLGLLRADVVLQHVETELPPVAKYSEPVVVKEASRQDDAKSFFTARARNSAT
jgi:hypothetical protein